MQNDDNFLFPPITITPSVNGKTVAVNALPTPLLPCNHRTTSVQRDPERIIIDFNHNYTETNPKPSVNLLFTLLAIVLGTVIIRVIEKLLAKRA